MASCFCRHALTRQIFRFAGPRRLSANCPKVPCPGEATATAGPRRHSANLRKVPRHGMRGRNRTRLEGRGCVARTRRDRSHPANVLRDLHQHARVRKFADADSPAGGPRNLAALVIVATSRRAVPTSTKPRQFQCIRGKVPSACHLVGSLPNNDRNLMQGTRHLRNENRIIKLESKHRPDWAPSDRPDNDEVSGSSPDGPSEINQAEDASCVLPVDATARLDPRQSTGKTTDKPTEDGRTVPRPKASVPNQCHLKATGQASDKSCGECRWVGTHGTPVSRVVCQRLLAEFSGNNRRLPAETATVIAAEK